MRINLRHGLSKYREKRTSSSVQNLASFPSASKTFFIECSVNVFIFIVAAHRDSLNSIIFHVFIIPLGGYIFAAYHIFEVPFNRTFFKCHVS